MTLRILWLTYLTYISNIIVVPAKKVYNVGPLGVAPTGADFMQKKTVVTYGQQVTTYF